MDHHLKISTGYWYDIKSLIKTFEVRLNDRNFKLGEKVFLYPIKPETRIMPNNPSAYYTIGYIQSSLGLEKGYVGLSIKDLVIL